MFKSPTEKMCSKYHNLNLNVRAHLLCDYECCVVRCDTVA